MKFCYIVSDEIGNSGYLQNLRSRNSGVKLISPSSKDYGQILEDSLLGVGFRVLIYGKQLAYELFHSEFDPLSDHLHGNVYWVENELEQHPDSAISSTEWFVTQASEYYFRNLDYNPANELVMGDLARFGKTISPFYIARTFSEVHIIARYQNTWRVFVWNARNAAWCTYKTVEQLIEAMLVHAPAYMPIIQLTDVVDRLDIYHSKPMLNSHIFDLERLCYINGLQSYKLVLDLDFQLNIAEQMLMIVNDTVGNGGLISASEFKLDQTSHAPIVESLLSKATILFDAKRYLTQTNNDESASRSVFGAYKQAVATGKDRAGIISWTCDYRSRNTVTGRAFPTTSVFSPTYLSANAIEFEYFHSRYPKGRFLSFDFVAFEPSIILHTLGLELPGDVDLHTFAADCLECSRDEAKKINNRIVYGEFDYSIIEKYSETSGFNTYLSMIAKLVNIRNRFVVDMVDAAKSGGLRSGYHKRIIRPKRGITPAGLFNNYTQASAADIFNEVLIYIDSLSEKCSIVFHKFDEVFLDVREQDIELVVKSINTKIAEIAEQTGCKLQVRFAAGSSPAHMMVLSDE